MIVIGKREAEEGKISLRSRSNSEIDGPHSLNEAVGLIYEEISSKSLPKSRKSSCWSLLNRTWLICPSVFQAIVIFIWLNWWKLTFLAGYFRYLYYLLFDFTGCFRRSSNLFSVPMRDVDSIRHAPNMLLSVSRLFPSTMPSPDPFVAFWNVIQCTPVVMTRFTKPANLVLH